MKLKFSLDKVFIKTLITLSLPIIAQNLITSSLNLLDNIMIGRLGVNEIAATGIASQFYMIFFITTSATCIGGGILISQYFGKKDMASIKSILGLTHFFSIFLALTYISIGYIFPEYIFGFFSKSPEVIRLGIDYLYSVLPSYFFTTLSLNYYVSLRSTGQTTYLMRGSLIGFIINGILNYVLIFGKLGFPALGVVGAGLATSIARLLEFSYIFYIVYLKNNMIRPQISHFTHFTMSDLKSLGLSVAPVFINDIIFILGMTAYSKAFSLLGTEAIATMQIANIVNNIFYISGLGLGIAVSILIGQSIGRGESHDFIQNQAKKTNIFSFILGIIVGIVFLIFIPGITSIFNVSLEIKSNISRVLVLMAIFLPLRFYGMNFIVGIFRGGGDLFYATVSETVAMWFTSIPALFIAAYFYHMNIFILYLILLTIETFVKIMVAYPRYKSQKWINKLV